MNLVDRIDYLIESIGNSEKRRLFSLGRNVSLALPGDVTLRPSKEQFKSAANELKITVAEAIRAWSVFSE